MQFAERVRKRKNYTVRHADFSRWEEEVDRVFDADQSFPQTSERPCALAAGSAAGIDGAFREARRPGIDLVCGTWTANRSGFSPRCRISTKR